MEPCLNAPCSRAGGVTRKYLSQLLPDQSDRGSSQPPSGPTILSLSPTEGPVGSAYQIEVTVTGTGFASQGNTVTFGDISIPDLASTEGGTRIAFFAPNERPSTGEVPPFVLMPGKYRVVETTPQGTNNPVDFILTRGPE